MEEGLDRSLLDTVDPSQMEPFERPVSTKPMRPIAWSIEKYEAAQLLALSRMTEGDVAKELKIPLRVLRKWKLHPEFSEYMCKLALDGESALKAKRLMIMQKILDARIAQAEERGDYAGLSNKDTLAIITELRKETEGEDSKEKSNWMQTLDVLLSKTAEKQAQLLSPSDVEGES